MATVTTLGAIPYERFYPYYAELCALSEVRKKPGFGVRFRSGMGGHALLYLNGVRRDRRPGYPALEVCTSDADAAKHGVGVSVNSHYKNVHWVAAEGRKFVYRGVLTDNEALTRTAYARTQAAAQAMGILEGVAFHDHFLRDIPEGMSIQEFMYELSVATDYAVTFGRDAYRVRVPLDGERMAAVVKFLNAANARYGAGNDEFLWHLLNNNCCHLNHNALAAAGIWKPWPTGQRALLAAFRFPVPKNEFVDLVHRTNDMPIENPLALYEDKAARHSLFKTGNLPTAAGALVSSASAIPDNEIYETERLRLIFYDNPFWGRYRTWFKRIFEERRYTDLESNLCYFHHLYETALERLRSMRRSTLTRDKETAAGQQALACFFVRYKQHINQALEKTERHLASLVHSTALPGEGPCADGSTVESIASAGADNPRMKESECDAGPVISCNLSN